jgi:NADH-quinone oxidoreductase subunit F
MLYNQPNPLEVRVLSRRFGMPDSHTIDTYLATEGYKALEKALGMSQDEIIGEVKASRRRGVSDRHEVGLRAAPVEQAEIHHGQRG